MGTKKPLELIFMKQINAIEKSSVALVSVGFFSVLTSRIFYSDFHAEGSKTQSIYPSFW